MLIQFRHLYPDGSLISKLVTIDHGNYIVKVSVKVAGTTLATGLAAAQTVETAEDRARERALAALIMKQTTNSNERVTTSQVEVVAERKLQPEEIFEPDVEVPDEPLSMPQESLSEQSVPDSFKEVSPLTSVASVPENNHHLEDLTIETEPTNFQDHNYELNSTTEESLPSSEITSALFETSSIEEPEPEDEPLPMPKEHLQFEQPMMPSASDHSLEVEEITFNEIIDQSDLEMKRLGWTKETGKEFLKAHYGKKSRLHLNDEELLAFLQYLQSLPTPE